MKINPFGQSGINPYKRQMNQQDIASKPVSKAADKVEISSSAKEMQQISKVSTERQAKVEELKTQVENGTYKVNPTAIAKSLVDFYSKN